MNTPKYLIFLSLLLTHSFADELKPSAWVPLPAIGSSPETGFQYGAYVMRIFEQTDLKQPQNRLELLLQGTTEEQYQAYLWPNYYLPGGWNLRGKVGGKYWPAGYFGLGNETTDEQDKYSDTTFESSVTSTYAFSPEFNFGFSGFMEYHVIADIKDSEANESLLLSDLVSGSQGGSYSGIGMTTSFDSRNNIDWPSQGMEASLNWDVFTSALGSDINFNVLKLRTAHYKAVANDVVALGINSSFASSNTPFTHLPRPAGDATLRGANGNRWIDQFSVGAQFDYRKTISNRWAVVGFLDTFQVSNSASDFSLINVHYSTGMGIRFGMTPDRFNIRFDMGYVDSETLNFAITVGEAF